MKIRIKSNVTNIKFDNLPVGRQVRGKKIIEMISNNPQKKSSTQ